MNGLPEPDDRLSAYLDGELSAAERETLDRLLAASPEWRRALADVRAARDALRRLPARDAPAGFWESVLAPDASAPDARVVALGPRRRLRQARRWAAVATAAAAVVAVLAVPERDTTGSGRGPGRDAATVRTPAERTVDAVGDDGTGFIDRVVEAFRW